MSENRNATMYLNTLIKKDTESAEQLSNSVKKLKNMNFEALCHIANIIYSFQLPEDVSLLVVNLAITQTKHNERVNIQKILQPLSRNQKQNFAMVLPLYEKAMSKYETIDIEKEDFSDKNTENEYITNLPQKIKLDKQKRDIEYLTSNNENIIIINPMRIPKQSWVMNVYAKSYDDYCDLVQTTIEDFKNNNMTIFLTKPEAFLEEIKNKKSAIAYSILINDNFSFIKLEEKTVLKLDEKDVAEIIGDFQISGRVGATIKLFGALKFSDYNGTLFDTNDELLKHFNDADDILNLFEEIGSNENIVKYYIEIMSGISMTKYKQFYKSIVFDTDEMDDVMEIVEKYDPHNLDFIVDTNKENIKILFIHKEHLRPLVKALIDEDCSIQINPVFDEYRI